MTPQKSRCHGLFALPALLVGVSACTVEVPVFRSFATRASEVSVDAAAAGGAGESTNATAVRADVYGCGARNRTGPAVLADILSRLADDLLSDNNCSVNADCLRTVIRPQCDEVRSACVPCADAVQQTTFEMTLILCLASASETCCRDPEAAPDCIVRQCAIGCRAQ